jgi:Ca-activated chloride channel family protein
LDVEFLPTGIYTLNQLIMETKSKNRLTAFTVILLIITVTSSVTLFAFFVHPPKYLKALKITEPVSISVAAITLDSTKAKNGPANFPYATAKTTMDSDIAEEVKVLNTDKDYLKFTDKFSEGSSTPKKLEKYLSHNRNGFVINVQSGSLITTPACNDSSLYVPGGFGSKSFYCFNAFTGSLRWAVDISDDGPSAPVLTDSLVIFNTESCTIFALNANTGKMVWSKWLGDPLMTNPVTDGENVFTAYPSAQPEMNERRHKSLKRLRPSHAFICLDAHTGKIKWQRWLNGDVMTSPVIAGNDVYLTTFSGTVYRIDKRSGNIISADDMKATSLPTVENDKIYVNTRADENGKVMEESAVLDKSSVKKVNSFNRQQADYLDMAVQEKSKLKEQSVKNDAGNGFVGGAPQSSGATKAEEVIGQSNVSSLQSLEGSAITVAKGRLINCTGNTINCMDEKTETKTWSWSAGGDLKTEGGYIATAPIVAGNYVITVTLKGLVKICGLQTGKTVMEFNIEKEVRNQPVVSRGFIFVPTAGGEVVVLNTNQPAIDGWPMFMKNKMHNTAL